MYTLLNIRKIVTVLHDKRPSASPGLSNSEKSIGNYPNGYKDLYMHVSHLRVPRNCESSFELFPLLDVGIQMRLQGMQYPERIKEYQKLTSLIYDWSGYDCNIMHGELRDGMHYTIEGGPIVTLKGEEVSFSQIAREKFAEIMTRITSMTRA